ncbi:MAG: S8 family serine peptidase, partial [Oligoflexales bacterium]|nr:S8 family serine peptidase [Oligoflexales bacterium]
DDLCYSDTRYYRATLKSAVSGRNKKGVVFVKAAGNGGNSPVLRNPDDANFDPLNTLPWHIVVGAVNASGVKASYSTPGSSLWISAPAGEYGWQGDPSQIFVDTPKWSQKPIDPNAEPPQEFIEYELKFTKELAPLSRFSPAIITTDLTYTGSEGQDGLKPCEFGYARSYEFFDTKPEHLEKGAGASGFNLGYHSENLNCDYTATMNGTSAAAPFVAGVVALMLEKNPDLTWRDVKHILASTAQKIDENIGDEEIAVGSPSSRLVRTHAWKRNNAGYNFHNYYGFGLVNAEAAVKMADPLTYKPLPPNISFVENAEVLSCAGFDSLDENETTNVEEGEPNPFGNFWEFTRFDGPGGIPQNSTKGVTKTVKVNKNVTIEALTFQVNINGENMSHIGIEVTSPSGMSSILLPPVNSADYKNFTNMVFTTNAFYGEKSAGLWTMKFVDAKASAIAAATVNEISLRIWGYRE